MSDSHFHGAGWCSTACCQRMRLRRTWTPPRQPSELSFNPWQTFMLQHGACYSWLPAALMFSAKGDQICCQAQVRPSSAAIAGWAGRACVTALLGSLALHCFWSFSARLLCRRSRLLCSRMRLHTQASMVNHASSCMCWLPMSSTRAAAALSNRAQRCPTCCGLWLPAGGRRPPSGKPRPPRRLLSARARLARRRRQQRRRQPSGNVSSLLALAGGHTLVDGSLWRTVLKPCHA